MEENQIYTAADCRSMSESEVMDLKRRIKTDLYFLTNNILRHRNIVKAPPLIDRVHGGICRAYVPKNPDVPFSEWSPIKERVILSSRGTLKSTIKAADIVQLILCEPDIRIIMVSGKLGLAKTNMHMARSYFETNEVLQFLFPEFCYEIQLNAEEFTSPARVRRDLRDPTIQIASFGSIKAGVHAEYIDLDDCTNEINCATPELVEKSYGQYDDMDPILEPGGYITFTGTRWASDDLPEYIKVKGEEYEAETGTKKTLYFFQPIWTIKKIDPTGLNPAIAMKLQIERDEREKTHRLVPNDVNLLWPEKLNAEYLWPIYRKNPARFAKHYLLNPELVMKGIFTRQLLVRQTRDISFMPLPHQCETFINWDLAGISGKGDFAVGIVGMWEQATGRLFIVDAIIERFTSSTAICQAILRLFAKYSPDHHRIESANGSMLLSGEMRSLADKMKLPRAFFPGWDAPSNESDAKTTRIMLLAGALECNQLQFFSGIPNIEELYKQFEKFTGKGKYKDDGPDCIAQMFQKWKDSVGVKAVPYCTPTDGFATFESEPIDLAENTIDPHADERANADFDFLSGFTVPHV